MINRICLFIDDGDDIDSVIERLPKTGKAKGIQVKYDTFNPMRPEFLNEDKDMDIEKVIEALEKDYLHRKIDLIACDFNLGDKQYFGNDILKRVRHLDSFCTLVIYSGNLSSVVSKILEDHDSSNLTKTLKRIQGIVNAKIEKFIDKDEHLVDQIIPLLITSPLELTLIDKLLENKNLEFSGTYPIFSNLKLGEIANHIRRNTIEGNTFSAEIVEQIIASMIDLDDYE